ncbi:hypothetical protein AeRB84_010989 [Aphanomyces euteiches]|nr:hypothetical protein AeRB84_010989 [Aphanomyces euteiches]
MTTTTKKSQELCLAALYGNIDQIVALRNVCDVNAVYIDSEWQIYNWLFSKKNTALHLACARGNSGIVKELLKEPSVLVTLPNSSLDTPLHISCRRGHKEVVELLLARPEIQLTTQNLQGNTALQEAFIHKNTEIACMLVAHPSFVDLNVSSQLLTATTLGFSTVVQAILCHPDVDVNCTDSKNNQTSLHIATQNDDLTCITKLLLDKSDINVNSMDEVLEQYSVAFGGNKSLGIEYQPTPEPSED